MIWQVRILQMPICKEVFFGQCDLSGAMFHNTDLTAADFSIAYNRVVIPGNNKLKNAVFSRFNIEELVVHLGIKLKD